MFKFISLYNAEFPSMADDRIKSTEFFKYLLKERKSVSSEYGYDFGIFNLPWGNFRLDYPYSPKKNINTSRFCGPSSDRFALTEIRNVIKLYISMKNSGWRKRYLPLSVVRMTSFNNATQYVVLGGNHRSIIGLYLGYKIALVRSHTQCFDEISYGDVNKWYHVNNNQIPNAVALEIFKSFFK